MAKAVDLNIPNYEGVNYDAGLPIQALNVDEFTKEDDIIIKQVIEPPIINAVNGNAIRFGSVILAKNLKKLMKQKEKNNMFIGIDLGTTNSSITSFDGKETRVHKSLEGQSDVTPSVIHIDKRGSKYYGHRAYNNEPYDPNNTAKLFKKKKWVQIQRFFLKITI